MHKEFLIISAIQHVTNVDLNLSTPLREPCTAKV